jgi:hypothetical protein
MPARSHLARYLLAAVLSSSLCSCAAYGAEFREVEIADYSGAEIWRQIKEFAKTRGFREDREETDRGRKIYQSRWVGQSVSFRRGSRMRFFAQIVRLDEDTADWLVRFYVEVQQVSDSAKNMRPKEEDWEYVRQDSVKEREFRRVLAMALPQKRRDTDESDRAESRIGR